MKVFLFLPESQELTLEVEDSPSAIDILQQGVEGSLISWSQSPERTRFRVGLVVTVAAESILLVGFSDNPKGG